MAEPSAPDSTNASHFVTDPQCRKIIVLSDLHKYSGVSNFSKGYDPDFPVYYGMYQDMEQQGRITTHPSKLSKKEMRTIEKQVREHYGEDVIKDRIKNRDVYVKKWHLREHDPKDWWKRRQEVFDSFRGADRVVFNGDIFDIECSQDPLDKIKEAVEWLKKRMESAPHTHFHFVLGNHEAFPEFVEAMQALEKDAEYGKQFSFHEHYVKINDALFLHGDEPLTPGKYRKDLEVSSEGLSVKQGAKRKLSELKSTFRAAYEFGNGFYHLFGSMQDTTLSLLHRLCENIVKLPIPGLKEAFDTSEHVFFGHTHDVMAAHYKGKTFYNTGSSVNSVFTEFQPMEISMTEGAVNEVTPLLAKVKEKCPKLHIERVTNDNPMSLENMLTNEDGIPARMAARR